MPLLLLGALVLAAILLAGRLDLRRLREAWKGGAAVVLGVMALGALVREQIAPALLLGGAAFILSGTHRRLLTRLRGAAPATLQSRFLDMTLDPDTGRIEGTVREGVYAGRSLAQLTLDEILEVRGACMASDSDGASLVEAYLTGRFGPAWRAKTRQRDAGPGAGDSSGAAMGKPEAWAVLGLKPGASPDAIKSAHRRLIIKVHPDQGGSTYLAAKINRARDVLLKEG